MNYFIIILLVYIIFNINSRLKKQEKASLLLRHVIVSLGHYEKVLLSKKLINQEDIHRARQILEAGLSKDKIEKKFENLKKEIVSYDPQYIELVNSLISKQEDYTTSKELARDAIYYKNNNAVRKVLGIIEADNIKKMKVNEKEWIDNKYGENFFDKE